LVKTRKSVLDEASLSRAVQTAYGLSPKTKVQLHRISGSDVYRVTDQSYSWFLKVYRSTKRDARLAQSAVRALDLLGRHGFSVPQLIQTRRGEPIMEIHAVEGHRVAYMYRSAEGVMPSYNDPKHGYLFGRTAARMHQVMDEVASPEYFRVIDAGYLFEAYIEGIERLLDPEASAMRFLRRLARALWQEVNHLLPTTAPQHGFCHGDLHTGNALLTDAGKLLFLDFDACGFGWRAMDIGTYYASKDWMTLSEESRKERRQILTHFLEGYNAVRPITEAESKSVDLFMAIRHFELLGLLLHRVPFSGAHWVNPWEFQAHLAWFQAWLDSCDWFEIDRVLDAESS
jgi:Ser/Thr protein kinase RdoA (MazF antagonist)